MRKLALAALLLCAGSLRAQTTYTPPVLPPWQSVADTAAAAQQMVDLQTFITAGNYKVSVSSSSTVGGTITINGQNVGTPNTGSFNTFQTTQGPTLALTAGANTITVAFTSSQQNIDFFTFTQQ